MEIWRGRVLWRGYIHPLPHPHPHTQLKKSGNFPYPYSVNAMTGSDNTHGNEFICHLFILVIRKNCRCNAITI